MVSTIDLPAEVDIALRAVAAVDDTDPAQLAGMVLADWLTGHRDRFRAAAAALDALAGDQTAEESHCFPTVQLSTTTSAIAEAFSLDADVAPWHPCNVCGLKVRPGTRWRHGVREGHRYCVDPDHFDEGPRDSADEGPYNPDELAIDEASNDRCDIGAPSSGPDVTPGPPATSEDEENDEPEPEVEPHVTAYPCPYCDRILTTPQGLGGHKSKAHPERTKKPADDQKPDATESPAGKPEAVPATSTRDGTRCAHCHGIAIGGRQVEGEDACTSCWRDAGRPT